MQVFATGYTTIAPIFGTCTAPFPSNIPSQVIAAASAMNGSVLRLFASIFAYTKFPVSAFAFTPLLMRLVLFVAQRKTG